MRKKLHFSFCDFIGQLIYFSFCDYALFVLPIILSYVFEKGQDNHTHFKDNGNGTQIPGDIQFPGYNEKWKRAVAADNGKILESK